MKAEALAPTRQKVTGAYYTPDRIASFLTEWAVRTPNDRVLDPSCGEGVFVLNAYERLIRLGTLKARIGGQVVGVDQDSEAVAKLRQAGKDRFGGNGPTLWDADFFSLDAPTHQLDLSQTGLFDAVIGNPPYIRYHYFTGEARKKALAVAAREGVQISALTSAWAPFLVHASCLVSKRGRLAMVLPAELLQVGYAHPVRRFLCTQFSKIRIVAFDKRVFGNALADTVLLLAERGAFPNAVEMVRVSDASDLDEFIDTRVVATATLAEIDQMDKWTVMFLPDKLRPSVGRILNAENFSKVGEIGRVDIGVVTGSNSLFVVRPSTAEKYGIEREVLTPIISGSRQLRGIEFRPKDLKAMADEDQPVYLIDAAKGKDEFERSAAYEYLKKSAGGAREGFKVRSRKPWYVVPYAAIPELFMSYMAGGIPRLVANTAGATSTNTVHRVFLHSGSTNARGIAWSFYNSVTMLSAELAGRSYGGGVFKLETGEAEEVILPLQQPSQDRSDLHKQVDECLRDGRTTEAMDLVNHELVDSRIADHADMSAAHEAWSILNVRRTSRMSSRGLAAA